jgi:hypothetical protein
VAYRKADAEAEAKAEAELAAREALAPLVAEGRARREGRPTPALVPAPRRFALLPAADVRRTIRRMPSGWSGDALEALREDRGASWLERAALVLAGLWYPYRFASLRREISWVTSLPFDLHGYLELLPILEEHKFAFDVDVELPAEERALLEDLLERVRGEHAPRVEVVKAGVSVVFDRPIAPRFVHRLVDEVLVPLHGVHRVTHVSLRRLRRPGE